MSFQNPFVIPAKRSHTRTIIFLHGRNSDGAEFAEEFLSKKTSSGKTIQQAVGGDAKWVFPNARERMSTVFQEELTEWFDIYSLSDTAAREGLQIHGLRESTQHILDIIEAEKLIIPSAQIFLGGISQGFATAIHALLQNKESLGGFVGMCGWLPLRNNLPQSVDPQMIRQFYRKHLGVDAATSLCTLQTPVVITHSRGDSIVGIEHGEEAVGNLRKIGMSVSWFEYDDDEHWLSEPCGSDDLCNFIGLVGH